RARIVAEAQRTPDRATEGTATWSLTTLRRAPPCAGWAAEGEHVHDLAGAARGRALVAARPELVYHGTRASTAKGRRRRGRRRRCRTQIKLIEAAYTTGEQELGLAIWAEDEAGPFQTIPHAGQRWFPTPRRRALPARAYPR